MLFLRVLVAVGEVIKFEGFLKVYLEGNDDDHEKEDVGYYLMLTKVKCYWLEM